jgi:dienelactone hydrolase
MKHRSRSVGALLLAAAWLGQAASAQTIDQRVSFDSAPYILGQFQQRRAIERGEIAVPITQHIEGYLSKPEGDGPFAAVIYLHGCSGLGTAARQRFAELLTGWSYAVLAVDSFATRGIDQACTRPMPDREADTWGAMSYLSRLPFIDRKRIAVVGSSQGGIVTMRLASTHDVKLFDIPDDLKFEAAVAFYPTCSAASQRLAIPTLILIGELDDWTPAKNCEQWMARRGGEGAPARLVVYPGAYHAFDFSTLKYGSYRFGHWLKYDADAAQRSTAEMHDFLAAQLGN